MMFLALLLLASLALSFLLSGMESALLSVSRVRVRHAANDGDEVAARLLQLLEDREGLLGAVTVANHIANVTSFGLIAWALVRQFGNWGFVLAFVLALPVFIVVLEMLPKTLFRSFPYRALRRFMSLLSFIAWFRAPFEAMSELPALTESVVGTGDKPQASSEDLRQLFRDIGEQRLLPASAVRLMLSVLDLRRLTAADVMVPMQKLVAVSGDVPVSTALRLAQQHEFLCLPVLADAVGTGYSGIFDTGSLPAHAPQDRLVRQHMKPMDEVDARTPALTVLQRLRRKGNSLALVRDHHAPQQPAVGIVTEEDLVAALLPKA